MTLDQLRVFVAVAERQHVTRAAEALNLAQSAVSASIAALEQRHGIALFHRVGRGIELTDAGRAFLGEARAVLARAEAAEQALAAIAGLDRGTLRIDASQTIAGYWLPRRLAAFRQAHPGIGLRVGIGNTVEVAAAVLRGTAELGFIEGEIDEPPLRSTIVARDQLVLLVPPGHEWAEGAPVSAEALAAADWVLREPGSGTRSALETALTSLGVSPARLRVALELPSNEAVRSAVEAGIGVTALSAAVAAPSLEAGLLARAALALPDRAFRLITHAERRPGPAAARFMEMVAG